MMMSLPYHNAIVTAVGGLDDSNENYLAALETLANLAQIVEVPKEHRSVVAIAFQKRATGLRGGKWSAEQTANVIAACKAVIAALDTQRT
jgi:hypothetical protein